MEDWEARLTDLEHRLVDWNRRVEAELARLVKERRLAGLFRKPKPAELEAAAVEARRRAGVEILVEAAELFDALCDRYLVVLPQERAKIRARVGGHEQVWELFWTYVEGGPDRVRRAGTAAELVRALVAVSIEDLRHDLEFVDSIVGRLALAGTERGLDWRAAFAQVSAVSNRSTGGGATQTREYLAGFERSQHFEREVAQALKAAAKRAHEPSDLMQGRGRGGAVA